MFRAMRRKRQQLSRAEAEAILERGTSGVLADEGEVRVAIDLLARRYHPGDSQEHRQAAIQKEYSALCMLELTVEHLTGKEAIELVRARDRAEP